MVLSLGMILANALGIGSKLFKKIQIAVLTSGAIFALMLILTAMLTNWTGLLAFVFYFVMGLALGIILATIELMVLNPLPTNLLAQGNGWIVSSMQAGYGIGSFIIPILYLKAGVNFSAYFLSFLVLLVIGIFMLFRKNLK
jgi:predicted MFS family arabinose efflux permease